MLRQTEKPTPQIPTILNELRPEQFNLWRHHPVTELVFDHYLSDLAWLIEQQVLAGWVGGKLTLQAEGEARGRLIAYKLIIEGLRLEGIRDFYRQFGFEAPDDAR